MTRYLDRRRCRRYCDCRVVHREPLTQQVTAVKAWLADYAISPELTMSLRANGYGLLFRSERARSA
ncbi:MAG: hypothetical protein QOD58_4848 [Mycobacterium sp.]|jgi:hypothetical protein|nr:hypothetical protein [Mycobacterium sp.]